MHEDDFLKFLNSYIAKTDILLSLYSKRPEMFPEEKMKQTKTIQETAKYILANYETLKYKQEEIKGIITDFDYPISRWIDTSAVEKSKVLG